MVEGVQDKNSSRFSIGYIEGTISLILNVILFIAKLIIGIKINSVALKADAWHTLSDALTSIILIAGLYVSLIPADKEHPFGHGRVEKIATLLIGLLLALVAANFFRESLIRIVSKKIITFNLASILVQVVCTVAKQGLAIFAFWAGKKSRIQAITADGWHHQSDAFSSIIFLIGVAFSGRLPLVDGYLGILISIMILWTSYDTLKRSISPLIGENVSEELVNKVLREVSNLDSRITSLHHFHLHRYGDHIELTFHIRLPKEISLEEAHTITKRIEEVLLAENIYATIHVEPY